MSYHIREFVSENICLLPYNTDEFHWLSVDLLWKIYVLWSKEVNVDITKLTKFMFSDLLKEELGAGPTDSKEYGKIHPFTWRPRSIFFRDH